MIREEIHKIPLIRLIIPLIIGIIFQSKFNLEISYYLYVVPISLLLIYIVLNSVKQIYQKYNFSFLSGIYFYIILFFLGILLVDNKTTNELINQQNGYIVGEVSEIPQEKEKSIKTIIKITNIFNGKDWVNSDGKAIIYLEKNVKSKKLNVGDRIVFSPNFNKISNKNNPNEFDYKSYLLYHLISQQAYLKSDNWKKISPDINYNFQVLSQKLRSKLLNIYKKLNIVDDEYSVLSALTLGYKDKLSENVKSWYSKSGAMHILAVSGLHVGIIYLILNSLLFFMNKCKICMVFKIAIIIILLFSYAFIIGLSASVLRASLMFSFVAIGTVFKRTTSIYNTLAASAIILLLINPYLVFDVGFQLSYLAVISIVFFQPKIFNLFHVKNVILRKIWALISVSIAAQIGASPIAVYYFHQFPSYFLLTNIIVIPLTAIIIYLAIALFAFSQVPIIAKYISLALTYVLKSLNFSVKNIENLPYSTIQNIYLSPLDLMLVYLSVIIFSVFIINKRFRSFKLGLISIIILLGVFITEKNINYKNKRVIIYNIDKISAYNFIDKTDNVLISDFNDKSDKKSLMFYIKNNWLAMGLANEKIVDLKKLNPQYIFTNLLKVDNRNIFIKDKFINFYGKRFLILNDKIYDNINYTKKLNLDYIIIANNTKVDIKDLIKNYNFKQIIIDSSNSKYRVDKIIKACNVNNIKYYNVSKEGAFVEVL